MGAIGKSLIFLDLSHLLISGSQVRALVRPPAFQRLGTVSYQNGPLSWEVLFDFRARRHCLPLDKWLAGWLRGPFADELAPSNIIASRQFV